MAKSEKVISCLRNERVIARFVPKENAMAGNNPKHVLSGGMADTATKTYVVPQLKSGQLVNVLTDAEKDFLEYHLGLEDNALSVYNVHNNYWKSFKVTLFKEDNVLDLSKAIDYMKYKVLLANKTLIAPSIQALQDYPKATYEYVLIKEQDTLEVSTTRLDAKKQCYKLLGQIEKDKDTLRVIISTLTRQPQSSKTKLDALNLRAEELIDRNAKEFLRVATDEYLPTKVLIHNAIEAGVINNRGGQLYMRDNNAPLCDNGEPTLSVAAAYLNKPKNSELKLLIEAKVNEYKNNEL